MPKWNRPLAAVLPESESIDIQSIARKYATNEIDLVVVLGPTASGKTRYAVHLAHALTAFHAESFLEHGISCSSGPVAEIISADSRQIYRGMDIGTGKDIEEYGDVPYHLIDIVDAGTQYNVFEFQRDFEKAWKDIRKRGRLPILCGGTGLYINSVVNGYNFTENHPLSEPRSDAQSSDSNSGGPDQSHHNPFIIGTLVSRELRNSRIDARLDARLKEGMVDEVKGLLEKGIPAKKLIAYGLEYKFITQFILGELSYEEMRERLAIAIHQFAKRQMTWFRGMERSGTVIHWTEV